MQVIIWAQPRCRASDKLKPCGCANLFPSNSCISVRPVSIKKQPLAMRFFSVWFKNYSTDETMTQLNSLCLFFLWEQFYKKIKLNFLSALKNLETHTSKLTSNICLSATTSSCWTDASGASMSFSGSPEDLLYNKIANCNEFELYVKSAIQWVTELSKEPWNVTLAVESNNDASKQWRKFLIDLFLIADQ